MNVVFAVSGVAILAVASLDIIVTTMGFAGGGPLTRRMANSLWRGVLGFHRNVRRLSPRILQSMGTALLLITIHTWIMMVFIGYALLFLSDPEAVISSATRESAGTIERLYFTGYTIFTLGMGDYVPGGDLWRILTAVASLNGLFIVTLSITYLLPVVSAVAEKYRLAGLISDLGRNPQEIVERSWDGKSFGQISTPLWQLVPMLELHSQKHLAYPILHYFPSAVRRTNFASSLAVMHEALMAMTRGVGSDVELPRALSASLEGAIDGFLDLMESFAHDEPQPQPPLPDWSSSREKGIPLASAFALDRTEGEWAHRRGLLATVVRDSGSCWEDDVLGRAHHDTASP